ncbi:DUF4827 domain-containing protein [Hoylesella saccharolytica]|jgi:hypothetical protein|uniref:DUF4827 domain-containing protein n=1 Tax=Hoylesella saccharolytica TaxID=633701 RepID=UPI002353825B|nr:DUF4827 domain-containing protein [Hoylesella saccharolytica]
MKKLLCSLCCFVGIWILGSCDKYQSYADQVKQERNAINQYIAKHGIRVISENDFVANGEKTDTSKNEFVVFESSGIYLQIIDKGCGKKIADGERTDVLCRFTEWNLLKDTVQLSSFLPAFAAMVDKMSVTNTSGTFTGAFTGGSGLMYQAYQRSSGTSVPSGWLTPLSYISIGRPSADGEKVARVRVIVPHDKGHGAAMSGVTPFLYEITYEKGK